MADELTYALITPYSLLKSRTGGILGRLLSLTNLEIIGATMFAPSDAFVDKYCATIEEQDIKPAWKKVMINYINSNFRRQNKFGITNRTVLLFFKGPQAIEKLKDDVIGPITSFQGHTIRGSFGDFVESSDGKVEYFEPSVLSSADSVVNDKQLALLAEYLPKDGGVLEDIVKFPEGVKPETTLVILKPFEEQSPLPGNIIDMFSRTGLYIVGLKLLRMSIAQAEEFYGPLINIFREKLKPKPEKIAEKLKEGFQSLFTLNPEQFKVVVNSILWAVKHQEPNIAEIGLTTLLNLIGNLSQNKEALNQFYVAYLMQICQDIFIGEWIALMVVSLLNLERPADITNILSVIS